MNFYMRQVALELISYYLSVYMGTICRSGFTTLTLTPLLEQSAVVHLLERNYISRMLAIEEHGRDDDLCGSGHRSITPYVHERFCVLLLLGV
jgi:hypothetical protein